MDSGDLGQKASRAVSNGHEAFALEKQCQSLRRKRERFEFYLIARYEREG